MTESFAKKYGYEVGDEIYLQDVVREEHPENAESPILSKSEVNATWVSDAQSAKALSPTLFIVPGNTRSVSAVPLNDSAETATILSERAAEDSEEHPLNLDSGMILTECISTETKEVHPSNTDTPNSGEPSILSPVTDESMKARSPILSTLRGIVT